MPINTDLLIAAPMLQDYLVDKDGTPMSAGTITCYQDNSRTTLKNWYYQSGTPGNYTYIPLPNPLTLSAAGTICDINGVDTIPFFYPYSELNDTVVQPYFITIVNHAMTNQITRANFPFLAPTGTNPSTGNSVANYIINNEFWRNIGSANLTSVTSLIVAPSQHDGFSLPDINFIKNITGGDDTVTFTPFPLTTTPILTGDITPEYYLNHTCTNTPTGENAKGYVFPISLHVNTLASVPFTATIQGQNVGGTGTGQNVLNLFIVQNTGTGTTPPAPFLIGTITLTTAWTKYTFNSVFPPTAGLTLGAGGDDALYLYVQVPLNMACSVNFCKPSIFLSATAPTNSFQTYDQIDSIINSPRTGDLRTSLNSFAPYGWIKANDSTIGSPSSGASYAHTDAWQLYNLIWNSVSNTFAPVAGGRGASAYADFTAPKTLTLTQTLSRVIGSVGPGAGLTNWALGQTTGTESDSTTLSIANMPAHNHPGSNVALGISVGTATPGGATFPTTGPTTVSVASQGSGTPFTTSNLQPSVFYNVFFKL